jgi:hypothetical protein
MKNFFISAAINIVIILISFFLFKYIISGPIRHKLYEKMMSSFAKFVIYIFSAAVIINVITALIFYRTRYVAYINIISPAIVSILVGFIASTVPTKGVGDEKKN